MCTTPTPLSCTSAPDYASATAFAFEDDFGLQEVIESEEEMKILTDEAPGLLIA